MSESQALWDLIQRYMRKRRGQFQREVLQADIARALSTSPQNVNKWTKGAGPKPENLVLIRDRLHIPYAQLLDAYLTDKGYLPEPEADATPDYTALMAELEERRRNDESVDRDAVREVVEEAKETDPPQSSPQSQSGQGA